MPAPISEGLVRKGRSLNAEGRDTLLNIRRAERPMPNARGLNRRAGREMEKDGD
jgi:hypothetical protein